MLQKVRERIQALGAAHAGLERMTRELRQASYVNAAGGVLDHQPHRFRPAKQ